MNEMHKIEIYNKKYNIKTKITIQKIQKRQLMVCQLQVIPFISNYKIILSNLHFLKKIVNLINHIKYIN